MVFVIALAGSITCQEIVNSPYGFSMKKPKDWKVADKTLLDENLKNVDLSEAEIESMLKKSNNTLLLMAFTKYELGTVEGIIPTIQVRLRSNPFRDFKSFKTAFIKSIDPSKMPFEDYKSLFPPKELTISGLLAVHYSGTYTLKTKYGQVLQPRSKGYAIPYGKNFFQITFIDGPQKEDCSAEFDELIQSIKIGH